MRKMYVFQHRDYGASWFDEDTCEEIGGVSDSDIVVSIEDAEKIIAERDRLLKVLEAVIIGLSDLDTMPDSTMSTTMRSMILTALRQTGGQDE